MRLRFLAAFCCAVACAALLAACGNKSEVDSGSVSESGAGVSGSQSEALVSSQPPPPSSSQAEALESVSESSTEESNAPEWEEAESDEREDPANYTYDEASGNLLLIDFNLQCTVSAEALEKLDLKTEDAFGDGRIIHIDFKYKTDSGSYRMFLVSVWNDAEEWDNQDKRMGPLPTEVARSSDKKKVALYAISSLVAENIADSDENKIFWQFINKNEKVIIDSLKFI